MSNNNMYDDLALLFGLPSNDKRIKLFLHLFLHTRADTTDDIVKERLLNYNENYWDKKPELYKSSGPTYVQSDDKTDIEWYIFAEALSKSLNEMNNKTPYSQVRDRRLDILNKYKDNLYLRRLFYEELDIIDIFGIKWDALNFVKHSNPLTDVNHIFIRLAKLLKLEADIINEVLNYHVNDESLKKYRNSNVFTYKIDKISIQLMLEDAKNAPTPLGKSSTFLASLDSNITDTYFRDSKDPSKLFTKDATGNLIEVQRGSTAFYDAAKKNCVGLGVKGKDTGATPDGNTCTDYLLQCINGNDPAMCRTYMTDEKFWGENENSIKQEVKNMLPAMALTTLEKFDFKQIMVNDTIAKRQINKVESVNSWLEKLKQNMDDTDSFNKIQSNTNLILYLTLLVDKINGSPQILNKNIVESEDTLMYNSKKFYGQLLSLYGLLPKVSFPNYAASVSRLSDTLRYSLNIAATQPQLLVVRQRGGSYIMDAEPHNFVSIELENNYNMFKNILKAHGKELDINNDTEIKGLFASFKNTENKVVQTMKIMSKYIELMEVFAHNDPNQVLNLETLNEITKSYEHQLNKTNRKHDTLTQALQTLADIVQEAVNKSGAAKNNNNIYTSTPFTHNN